MKNGKKMVGLAMAFAMSTSMIMGMPVQAAKRDPLVILPYQAVETCDPYATEGGDKSLLHQVYDYLFSYDNEGNPIPCLVESYEISEDGKTYTMHLRQDVSFHDGCKFTADDVVFSFDTMSESTLGSTLLTTVSSIKKVDDYTVEMQKATAFSSVEKFFCDYMAIVDAEVYGADKNSYISSPVGTGAYKMDHMDETTGYVYLTANEDYFQGVPEVKNLEIHTPLESSVALVALENGEANYAGMMNNSDLELARQDENLKVVGTEGWGAKSVLLIGEPYNSNENLRKAIYFGINRENAAIYNGELEPKALENMYADRLMGDYIGTVDMYGYDPDKAMEYLAQSGYDGSVLEINISSDMEQIAVSMQADLTAIGINCQVNILDANTVSSRLLAGTLGITVLDMGVAYSSPEEMMSYFVSTGFYGEQGLVATSETCDAAIDTLKEMWNEEERHDAGVKALEAFRDLSVFFPLYSSSMYVTYSAEYDNIQPIWAQTYCPYFYQVTYAE